MQEIQIIALQLQMTQLEQMQMKQMEMLQSLLTINKQTIATKQISEENAPVKIANSPQKIASARKENTDVQSFADSVNSNASTEILLKPSAQKIAAGRVSFNATIADAAQKNSVRSDTRSEFQPDKKKVDKPRIVFSAAQTSKQSAKAEHKGNIKDTDFHVNDFRLKGSETNFVSTQKQISVHDSSWVPPWPFCSLLT
jgi:hypothetical protein